MKKFIKDWWPLLLIAAVLLWKKTMKKNGADNSTIRERLIANGWTKSDVPCPVCGSEMYVKGTSKSNGLNNGSSSFALMQCCTNPECVNSRCLDSLPL